MLMACGLFIGTVPSMHALTHYYTYSYGLCIVTSAVALLSNSHGFTISCVPLLSLSVGTRRLNSEVGSPSAIILYPDLFHYWIAEDIVGHSLCAHPKVC